MLPDDIFFKDWSPSDVRDVLTMYNAKYSVKVRPPIISRFLKKQKKNDGEGKIVATRLN